MTASPTESVRRRAVLMGALFIVAVRCTSSTAPVEDADALEPDGARDGSTAEDSDVSDVSSADFDSGPVVGGGPLTIVMDTLEATEERLCDLDGDGLADNVFADLGSPGSELFIMVLNAGFSGMIEDGMRLAVHSPWVDELSGPDDPQATLLFFGSKDGDAPDDPSDDFDGDETYYADADYFFPCGAPRYFGENALFEAGRLTAEFRTFEVTVETDPLLIRGARFEGVVAPGGTSATLDICGYGAIRDMGAIRGFSSPEITLLEEFLGGGAAYGYPSLPGLAPDVDVDGDGLERILLDSLGRIESCIDGDSTPIEGSDCWSDPRIADGLSFNFRFAGAGARLGGREPGWESVFPEDDLCSESAPDDSLLTSPAHDEGECAELDEGCDPLRSGGPCCEPDQMCTGTYEGVHRCSASCEPTSCESGPLSSMCHPTDAPSDAAGYCMPVAGYIGHDECAAGSGGCGSASSICAAVDSGGWTSCFPSCVPLPSGCDETTHVCVPQVFGAGGACVRREQFEAPPP